MALVKAAFLSTQFLRTAASVRQIGVVSQHGLSSILRIGTHCSGRYKKKSGSLDSFPQRFRRGITFSVTDVTAAEWCEKQMECYLLHGKPEPTKAMKAGIARHEELEQGVMMVPAKMHLKSAEEIWAQKFIGFIYGLNRLFRKGLTRELPLLCCVDNVWIVGKIDEIQMPPLSSSTRFPTLVEIKTRRQASLPSEAQKRNGRLQLMIYKHMWDMLVAGNFSSQEFFDNFSLDPNHKLSLQIRAKLGFHSKTLMDLVSYSVNICRLLPTANDQLMLRYELQKDKSLLGEEKFSYDHDWVMAETKSCLDFLLGKRQARYAPPDERWKCKYCKYASKCPANSGM